ncbi:hypothetical protein [Candidatus Methylacidiphilum infernorum]|uniref:Uncharacterized protein n=1 Tax=Methylacidiphilum infernorum (isolate V4) TaxID=481448 RepID=B3DY67_METI4|nr:hypothetical protein [Candidatus Methylacidiphilum infernorum]ACD82344.1 Hypothetical protein Minf_0284 [Methylacidiphilum infernorum V4]
MDGDLRQRWLGKKGPSLALKSLLFLFWFSFGGRSFSHPDIHVLSQHVVDESEKMAHLIHNCTFKEDIHLEKLDHNWNPYASTDIHFFIGPGGNPLNLDRFPEKERKFVVSEARLVREALETLFSLHQAIYRFDLKLIGEEALPNGQSYYIIDFIPKKNLPYRTRMEKVCNFLTGRLKIRQKDFSVSEARVKLTQPVDLFWFLARLEKLSFFYSSQSSPEGSLPGIIDFIYHLALPFKSIREHEMIRISEYHIPQQHLTTNSNPEVIKKDGL